MRANPSMPGSIRCCSCRVRFPTNELYRSGWLIEPLRGQPRNMRPALVIRCGTLFTRGKLLNSPGDGGEPASPT